MRHALLILLLLSPSVIPAGRASDDLGDGRAGLAAPGDTLLVEVGGVTRAVTAAELRALAQDTVPGRAHDGPMQQFVGPSLAAVLATHGARLDSLRGRTLAQYVLVEARDGYRVVFGAAELNASFTGRRVILAHSADGVALDTAMGPWRVIAEGELRPARWIRQVQAIRLRVVAP